MITCFYLYGELTTTIDSCLIHNVVLISSSEVISWWYPTRMRESIYYEIELLCLGFDFTRNRYAK